MTDEQAEEVANAAAGEAIDRQEPDDVEGLRTRLEEEKQRAGKHYESWQRSAAD